MSDCKSCKFKTGDCGKHFESVDGEVDLTIPAESSCDRFGQCMFWKRSIESRRDEIRRLHNLIEKHINQINILEREIQREKEEDERIEKAARAGMEVNAFVVGEFILEVEDGQKEGKQK